MDKNLGYLKTILRGIKGVIPNDIYLDEELQQIVIPTKSGCNITNTREDIVDRIKNTWLKNYIKELKYSYGDFIFKIKEKTMPETIYKPNLIIKAKQLEDSWINSLGLKGTEQPDKMMFFIIEDNEIKNTKLVDKKTFKDYKPQDNEYYLEMIRDRGDVVMDYNLSPVSKLVDLWNESFFKNLQESTIIESLNNKINEALEIPVVKDGNLKMPVDELFIRTYDERQRYGTDWITEYNYVSEKSLTPEEFEKIIKDASEEPIGQIYPLKKRKLTFGNGKVYYRHILKTAMY